MNIKIMRKPTTLVRSSQFSTFHFLHMVFTEILKIFSNIPGLSPKSLHSAYDVKAYVLFIAVCQAGTLSLVAFLVLFHRIS